MNIVNHKFEGVPFVPTTKMGKGTLKPKLIVLHFTAGWTTEGDIHTLAKSDRKASAHTVLSREGEWTQIVPFNKIAWHAGPSKWGKYIGLNEYSIGIEVSNIGYLKKLSNGTFVDEYGNRLDGDGNFLNAKRKAKSAPKTWHEHYNPRLAKGPTYVWEPFYDEQLDALEDGVREMLAAYPQIDEIVTHEEIDTRGWKTDINGGRAFPMKRFTDLLARNPYNDREDGKVDAVVTLPPSSSEGTPIQYVLEKPEPLVAPDTPSITFTPPPGTVGELKQGDEVKIIHADEKWAYVELAGGLKGWLPRIRLRIG